jgi:hypothetical protein
MESTWASRELPVLNAVVTLLDRPDAFMVRVIDIAEHTGLKPTTVAKALDALEGPYVGEFTKGLTGGVPDTWYVAQVTASARQAVGQWPTAENVLAQLVDGLNDAAERERDPERKNRLRAIAGGLGGSVRDVAVDIVARIIEHRTGLG